VISSGSVNFHYLDSTPALLAAAVMMIVVVVAIARTT